MSTIVQACAPGAFDGSTQTCSTVQWVEVYDGILPPLTIEEGLAISTLIVSAWALGYSFKFLRRYLMR